MEPDSKPQLKSKAAKNTPIDAIIKQRQKNPLLSITDQAKINGISKQALHSLLKRHGIDVDSLQDYKDHKADLLAGKQELVLSCIDADAVKRMVEKAPMAAVTLFNSCFNAERLERGLSTSNSLMVYASAVEAACSKEPALPQDIVVEAEVVADGVINSNDSGNLQRT